MDWCEENGVDYIFGLPRRGPVPHAGGPDRDLGTLTVGAACLTNPSPLNPQPRQSHRPALHRTRTAVPARSKPTDLIDVSRMDQAKGLA